MNGREGRAMGRCHRQDKRRFGRTRAVCEFGGPECLCVCVRERGSRYMRQACI